MCIPMMHRVGTGEEARAMPLYRVSGIRGIRGGGGGNLGRGLSVSEVVRPPKEQDRSSSRPGMVKRASSSGSILVLQK